MALNATRFSLATAMSDVWNIPSFLTDEEKSLISQTLGGLGIIPSTEDQLDTLHQTVTACKVLNRITANQVHWLTPQGQRFPVAVATYLQKVATRLHLNADELPAHFLQPLIKFVRSTNSHIATLNYDKLLYGAFIDAGLLAGYNGNLVDGLVNNGFSANNLLRLYGNNFGYYLHLHGSPLFYEYAGTIRKYQRHELSMYTTNPSEHIVLTHVQHKRSVIDASPLLSVYWNYLQFCLSEAQEIFIVGYSGCDTHLNNIISIYAQQKRVLIVEWKSNIPDQERLIYWTTLLNSQNIALHRPADILTFNSWV